MGLYYPRKPIKEILRAYWADSVARVNPMQEDPKAYAWRKSLEPPDPNRSEWGRWDLLIQSWNPLDAQWIVPLCLGLGIGLFLLAVIPAPF